MSLPTVKLCDVAEINPRLKERPASDITVSFVAMADVDADTGTTTHGHPRTFREVAKGYTQFTTGDLLVAKITPCFENGKIAQANTQFERGAGSTEFHVIRPDTSRIDSRFLLRYLRQPWVRVAGERRMTGSAGQRRVPEAFLANLEVSLPPISEQRRIADVLDRVEALRAKRRDAIALLDDLAQSIFREMFGDPRVNPVTDSHILGELVTDFRYGTSNKSGPQGFPALRIPNVVGGALDMSEIKTVQVSGDEFDRLRLGDGDLLFVRTNGNPEYVGRCAVFDRDLVTAAGFQADGFIYASYLIRARLNVDLLHPIYAREYLLSPTGRAALRTNSRTSAGQFNINIQGLSNIPLTVPPVDLQELFARRIKRIEAVRRMHLLHLAEIDSLFSSIQHRAFRGELWADSVAA